MTTNSDKMRLIVASQRNPKGYARLYRSKGQLAKDWIDAVSNNIDKAIEMLEAYNKEAK